MNQKFKRVLVTLTQTIWPDFLLFDLREYVFRFWVGGTEKRSENDQLTVHFRTFFIIQSFFLISPE